MGQEKGKMGIGSMTMITTTILVITTKVKNTTDLFWEGHFLILILEGFEQAVPAAKMVKKFSADK